MDKVEEEGEANNEAKGEADSEADNEADGEVQKEMLMMKPTVFRWKGTLKVWMMVRPMADIL